MEFCDRCRGDIDVEAGYVHLTHHHTHMEFDSRFCSPDCAVAYLEDGLLQDP
jgi:hypothetical protein